MSSVQDFQAAVRVFQSQSEELAKLLNNGLYVSDTPTEAVPLMMAKNTSVSKDDSTAQLTTSTLNDSDSDTEDDDSSYYDSDDEDSDWDSDLEDLEAELTGTPILVDTDCGGKMMKTTNSSPALLAMVQQVTGDAPGASFNPLPGLQNLAERMKKSESTSYLQSPDFMKETQPDTLEQPYASVKPDEKLQSILEGFSAARFPSSTWHEYFVPMTEDNMDAYTSEVEKAVRSEDYKTLRAMVANGETLQCCNRHGESILHIACRRGSTELIRFLLEEAKVDPRIRDDVGRTPLHDACWSHKPNMDVVMMLLQEAPELLFIIDHRGFTPLCYCPRATWGVWNDFLQQHRQFLRDTVKSLRFDRARYFIKTMVPCLKF